MKESKELIEFYQSSQHTYKGSPKKEKETERKRKNIQRNNGKDNW